MRLRLTAALAFSLWFPVGLVIAEPAAFPRVHHVAGGPSEMFANAYILEGRSQLIVIDSLLTRTASADLRRRVETLGKPLVAVVVTHAHPDHYGGITELVAGRPGIAVIAVKGVDLVIRRDDPVKGERLRAFGIDWSERRTFPNVAIEGGVQLIFDDLVLTSIDMGEGESHHDSVWILEVAAGEWVFVGDLVMEGVHAYTADAHTGRWLESLRVLDATLESGALIYPGHGEPGGRELLEQQARYLNEFRSEVRRLAAGRPELTDDEEGELHRHMVELLGHDRVARWIFEGADPVARELAGTGE